jgi:hypothetical protein
VTSPVTVFPFDQLLLHREFPQEALLAQQIWQGKYRKHLSKGTAYKKI